MNHDEARDLLAEYALELVTSDERRGIEGHAESCDICGLEARLYVQAAAALPIAALAGARADIDAAAYDRIRDAVAGRAMAHGAPRPRSAHTRRSGAPHQSGAALPPAPAREHGLRSLLRRPPSEPEPDDDFSLDIFADTTPLTEAEEAIWGLERDWGDDARSPPKSRPGAVRDVMPDVVMPHPPLPRETAGWPLAVATLPRTAPAKGSRFRLGRPEPPDPEEGSDIAFPGAWPLPEEASPVATVPEAATEPPVAPPPPRGSRFRLGRARRDADGDEGSDIAFPGAWPLPEEAPSVAAVPDAVTEPPAAPPPARGSRFRLGRARRDADGDEGSDIAFPGVEPVSADASPVTVVPEAVTESPPAPKGSRFRLGRAPRDTADDEGSDIAFPETAPLEAAAAVAASGLAPLPLSAILESPIHETEDVPLTGSPKGRRIRLWQRDRPPEESTDILFPDLPLDAGVAVVVRTPPASPLADARPGAASASRPWARIRRGRSGPATAAKPVIPSEEPESDGLADLLGIDLAADADLSGSIAARTHEEIAPAAEQALEDESPRLDRLEASQAASAQSAGEPSEEPSDWSAAEESGQPGRAALDTGRRPPTPGDPFAFLDELMFEDDFSGPAHLDGEGEVEGERRTPPGPSTRRRGLVRGHRPSGGHGEFDGDDDYGMEPGADAFGVSPSLGEESLELSEIGPGRRRFLNRIRDEATAELVTAIPEFRGDRALDDAIHLAVAPTIVSVPGVTSPMPGTVLPRYDRSSDSDDDDDDGDRDRDRDREEHTRRQQDEEEDEEVEDSGGWRLWAILFSLVAFGALGALGYTFYQLKQTREEANVLEAKVQSFAVQIGLRGDNFVGVAYMLPSYGSGILILDGIPTLPEKREYVVWAEGTEGVKNMRSFQSAAPSRTYVDLPRMPVGFRRIFVTEEVRSTSGARAKAPTGVELTSGFPPVR